MTQLTLDTIAPIRNELEKKYRLWLEGPGKQVFPLFERFALEMVAKHRRFGIALLAERVRWEVATTWASDAEGWKINNNHRSYIARDLLRLYPALEPYLSIRCLREEEETWNVPS